MARLPALYEPHRLPAVFPFRAIPFRMGDRAPWDRHRHDALEIGLCHSGNGSFLVSDKTFRFGPGSVLVVNDRELHRACSDPGTTSSWTFLFIDPPRLLAGLPAEDSAVLTIGDLAGAEFPNHLTTAQHPEACALVAALVAASTDRGPHQRSLVRGLALALVARLHRLPGRDPARGDSGDLERLEPALRLITARHAGNLPISALARACGLGESALRARFVAAFGHGPREHIIRFRLHQAAQRLRNGDSVTDAALASGFSSLSAFHRHFRSAYDASPRDWQRRG